MLPDYYNRLKEAGYESLGNELLDFAVEPVSYTHLRPANREIVEPEKNFLKVALFVSCLLYTSAPCYTAKSSSSLPSDS